jgi:phosphatidyl-myo-inositol dimannoside synthase
VATSRLRALIVTPDFPPAQGGIQLLAQRLAVHLTATTVRVITVAAPGAAAADRESGLSVRRVGWSGKGGGPGAASWRGRVSSHRRSLLLAALNAAVVFEVRRFRPDVVLNMHVVTSMGAALAGRRFGVPYIQYIHADEVLDRPWLTRAAIRQASAVIAVSDFSCQLAERFGADPTLVHHIPNGVDAPRPPLEARAATPTFITVSRIADQFKGHDLVLRCLPRIAARVPSVRWVVVGDGPLRASLEKAAGDLGVADRVLFTGSVTDEERDRWLDRSHLFVMPSRLSDRGGGEGFGIAYLEAGAHRIPVVGGAVAGSLAAVEHGKTGLLVEPTDEAAVADAIIELLTDQDRAEAMGRAGEQRAREFSWSSTAAAVEVLIGSVAASVQTTSAAHDLPTMSLRSRAVVVSTFPPLRDGIARYAEQFSEALAQEGTVVRIGLTGSSADRVLRLDGGFRMLRLLIPTRSEDSVWIMWHHDFYIRGRLPSRIAAYASLGVVARRRRTRVIVHEPIDSPRAGRGRFRAISSVVERRVQAWCWRSGVNLVFHSERERQRFLGEWADLGPLAGRAEILEHGRFFQSNARISTDEARATLHLPREITIFLCIGFLGPHKGFDRAVRAFACLPDEQARLYIVGCGLYESAELRTYISELEALVADQTNVYFEQRFLSDDEFDRWIQAASAVVVPYRAISSSSVVARARLLGTRVVVTAVSGLPEQVGPGDIVVHSDAELTQALSDVARGIRPTDN